MVTFSPAVDVVRDARWGRVVEMPGGEDPYLGSCFASAMVEGFQDGLGDGRGIASCVKHFAGYGAAEGGREYNTVDMSERRFCQDYLPPYKAAVDAGARMVMTSFNTVGEDAVDAACWRVLTLPHQQVELLRKVRELGKRTVVVLFNGRPLVLEDVLPLADAVVDAWWPGTAGGNAIADVLFGRVNPSGRLTMTFPVTSAQALLYYGQFATGRPAGKNHAGRFVTGWLDAPVDGRFPFGYGLSYHTAGLLNFELSSDVVTKNLSITASVTLTNMSDIAGSEVVQLYIRDLVGSVVRPVKELKGFQKVTIGPSKSACVKFEISEEMLRFWRRDMTFGSEPGDFVAMVGLNSRDVLELPFTLR
jgi:beta-glucosidase